MKKATFGLAENIAAAVSYVGLFVTGAVFFLFEKENKAVRFHALQSVIWFAFYLIAIGILHGVVGLVDWIPLVGGLITWVVYTVIGLVGFASWVFLIFKACTGEEFRMPIIGDAVHEVVYGRD